MQHLILLVLLILAALGMQSCQLNKTIRKPNILFIAIDDMKPLLGCFGDSTAITPNMDNLAGKGVVFLNNHCQQAVCGPSRASLLTGLYPDQNKTWGFTMIRDAVPDVLTLPQHFKNNGYTTVNISKIFDYRTVDAQWDSVSWTRAFPLSDEEMAPYYPEETGPVTGYFYHSPRVKDVFKKNAAQTGLTGTPLINKALGLIKPATECMNLPDNAYKDGVFANRAVEELKSLARSDSPFFLAVGFERPHLPFTAPKKYWEMYDSTTVNYAQYQKMARHDKRYFYGDCSEIRSYTAEDGSRIFDKLKDGQPLTKAEQQRMIHGYYAAITYIDAQVERILRQLQDSGLADNTIIVIWGDHGWHLGDHGLWGKATNFEQATRAPMIIAAPNIAPGKIDTPTGFIDIFPTLCDLSGLPAPGNLAGRSLKPLMKSGDESMHQYAVSQFNRDSKMGYTIRDKQYRYVEWIEEGLHVNPKSSLNSIVDRQLFDYQADPLETVNQANTAEYQAVQTRLSTALRAHINLMKKADNP